MSGCVGASRSREVPLFPLIRVTMINEMHAMLTAMIRTTPSPKADRGVS